VENRIAESSAEALKGHARSVLAECSILLDEVVRAPAPRGAANTLVPFDDLHRALSTLWNLVGLLRSVHPDQDIRAASEECEQEVARFANDLALNREVFEAVSSVDASKLDAAGRRMLAHVLRDFHRSGVDRDERVRERVRVLREDLVALGQDFTRNILTDVRSIVLENDRDLDGLPADYVRRHEPGPDGTIKVTTDYPDYHPFMAYARSARRRMDLYTEFRRRGYPSNLEVLDRLIAKRHELANLLGYPSWAAYVTEDKMIKTPEAVARFIDRVTSVAEGRARREYEALLAEKRKEASGAAEVHDWEKGYLEEIVKAKRFRVDSKQVREYFSYGRVKDGVLALTEELFGIRFEPAAGAPRWHGDVEVLDVLEGKDRVGRVYLDMHPREGKFKHAAMFPVRAGVKGKSLPEAALVCNFPDPRTSQPALLEHDDVVTFFHEFGHLLHHLFARDQEWVRFSGTSTEWDFIEVPSQLYEEWAWEYDVLRRFAVHHATGETIPEALVGRMRKARSFGRALWVRHQMFYAAVSLKCHGVDPTGLDTSSLIEELQNQYSLFRFVEGTYFQASFGHLDDYSALYYTYMWSLVIAKDIYQEFRKNGVMGRSSADRYRRHMLAPGGSADATELVRMFLGRDYTFDAFEAWLGGE
jgi:thimet oligopeptidase